MEQAMRWLDNPGMDDGGVGLNALRSLLDEARRLANQLPPQERDRLLNLCSNIDQMANNLAGQFWIWVKNNYYHEYFEDLERRGLGNTPEAQSIRQQLRDKLRELGEMMKRVLTDKVVEDFADITTPLKAFVEAVYAP